MQIVIDIPEDVIEGAKSSPNYYPAYHFEKIWKAIVNGIPLPKGHGDLKDADELTSNILCKTFGLRSIDIKNAQTIIEADKAESEDTFSDYPDMPYQFDNMTGSMNL